MINAELLKLMCCPETHQELRFADPSVVAELNGKVEQGILKNRAGIIVTEKMDAGLLRLDGKLVYPVRGNIPVMLVDEAIPIIEA
jgi:uncharacterized protein YbaR (Trm112 family)